MFNRTFISQPRVVEHVTKNVAEKRAPTDESVKLLREMETAARAEVIKAVRVTDAPMHCVIHKMRDACSMQFVYHVVFSLGGRKEKVTVELEDNVQAEAAAAALHKAVSERVAQILLASTGWKEI